MSAPPPTNVSAASPYSPITLGDEYPKMGKLLFVSGCAIVGSLMNVFFVAAFFVERSLRKPGNVFHACVGLADLIITAIIMPTCAVILLSGQWDEEPVCTALQFLAEAATYCYNVFFLMAAIENYNRICCDNNIAIYTKKSVSITSVLIFVMSFITAGVGVYSKFDYNYCTRNSHGHFYFRFVTALLFHGVPFIVITLSFIFTIIFVRRKARKQINYKRSHQFHRDYNSTVLNLTAYLFFALMWTPYMAIVNEYPNTADIQFYHCAWLGLSRSVLTSFLYAFMKRNFRRAFAHLFKYCCCKMTLASSSMTRHRRALEYRPMISDVRVHIMHQAILVNGVPRYTSRVREIQEL